MNRIGAFLGLSFLSTAALAMSPNSAAFVSVPVLDDVGLAGITVVLALVGAIAIRRRNKK